MPFTDVSARPSVAERNRVLDGSRYRGIGCHDPYCPTCWSRYDEIVGQQAPQRTPRTVSRDALRYARELLTACGDRDSAALTEWWNAYYRRQDWYLTRGNRRNSNDRKHQFIALVERVTGDEFVTCGYCDGFEFFDDTTDVDDRRLCQRCVDNECTECAGCNELRINSYLYGSEDGRICEYCQQHYYHWCDECETYIHDESEHYHAPCCEAAHKEFRFPIDGNGTTIRNDEEDTLAIGGGDVSREGRHAVYYKLRDNFSDYASRDVAYQVLDEDKFGQWQTREGNFTKRVAKLYLQAGLKIPPPLLAEIGNIARQHTTQPQEITFAFTRELNLSAGEFAHESSCWWGGESRSRCILKQYGGLAIRTFTDGGSVHGRAWILPLDDRMRPTWRTDETTRAYIVFNVYGHEYYTMSRLVAQLTGKSYRKIGFTVDGMWINAGGILVASAQDCDRVSRIDFDDLQVSC